MTRDNQKSKVYGAEFVVDRLLASARSTGVRTITAYGSTLTLPDEAVFADLASMQRYVDAVLALDWVRATFDMASEPVTVRARKGQTRAHYEGGTRTIAVPLEKRFAMRETYLLHEIAHHFNLRSDESHGPSFVGIELLLQREILGPEVGLLLAASMHEAGVKVASVNRVDSIA